MIFHVKIVDLRFDLRLELVRGALEFIERAANLAANFRQLLGPKDDESQKKNENHLWKAEVHASHDTAPASCQQSHSGMSEVFRAEHWNGTNRVVADLPCFAEAPSEVEGEVEGALARAEVELCSVRNIAQLYKTFRPEHLWETG